MGEQPNNWNIQIRIAMSQNDIKKMKTKKCTVQRWASGCLEQSGGEGLNSRAIETWWKDLLLLLKASPISQGHLINRQQLSPFQMVIFFLLNASFSMPYCLLQQTLVGFFHQGFSSSFYGTLYIVGTCAGISLWPLQYIIVNLQLMKGKHFISFSSPASTRYFQLTTFHAV